ncbi:MAG TPA: serine/threonine-protein kinase [Acidobacteriota bacterium]|nr:serine/threonine-protein kinase [Acidobacteriota bacterium]
MSSNAFEFKPNDKLGDRYVIQAKLGEGGMGTVYRALDERNLNRPVAIKLINAKANQRFAVKARQRLLREREAYLRITHPNVVQVIDSGVTDDGNLFLVQEYIAGESLDKLIRRKGQLPKNEILSMVGQMSSALEAIHSEGVLHRDLKPTNIMLQNLSGGGKQVKIIDLGIARVEDSVIEDSLTVEGASIGTPWYSSPEQLTGAVATPLVDLWALAVIAYQLVTGVAPFREPTIVLLVRRQLSGPISPKQLRPDLPEAVSTVLMKALSYEPSKRYQTVREFSTALNLAFAGSSGTQTSNQPGLNPIEVVEEVEKDTDPTLAPANKKETEAAKVAQMAALRETAEKPLSIAANQEVAQAGDLSIRQESSQPAMSSLGGVTPQSGLSVPSQIVVSPSQIQVQVVLPTPSWRHPRIWFFIIAVVAVIGVAAWMGRQPERPPVPPPHQGTGTNPIVTPATSSVSTSLSYSLIVDDQRGAPFNASGREIYRSGDSFKFVVETAETGYLYLLNESTSGDLVQLFPARHLNQENSMVGGNQKLSLPQQWYQFDKSVGAERLILVFSRTPVELLEKLQTKKLTSPEGIITSNQSLQIREWIKSNQTDIKQTNLDFETRLESATNPLVAQITLQHR